MDHGLLAIEGQYNGMTFASKSALEEPGHPGTIFHDQDFHNAILGANGKFLVTLA
jgi:hypothetical protein